MHFLLFSLFNYILLKKLLRATIKPSFLFTMNLLFMDLFTMD
nr:MAG TPA: hypothetical protein [Caudoviricetes sp.]